MTHAVPRQLVAIDLGGTNIRFAIAEIAGGRVTGLGEPVTLQSAEFNDLPAAWAEYERQSVVALPPAAALSVAGPVVDGQVQLTNLPWRLDRTALQHDLGLDAVVLVNDFEAVGHAVAQLGPGDFSPLCGPDEPLPSSGVISIIGPGPGLGVAQLWRDEGDYCVVATEGGHIGFAPTDAFEDALLARLRAHLGRVSVERVVAGPGISDIYAALGGGPATEDIAIWTGDDPLALQAVDRFCMALGSVAGDLALAHGARGVVIGGGIGQRLRDILPASGFAARFVAKGRFRDELDKLPVKIITHPQPGLFGAAAAFLKNTV
jgi:glucokinase